VLRRTVRVGLLGLVTLLLVGSYAASAAYAGGPYIYHRAIGEKSNLKGVKVSEASPEKVEGKGNEQRLRGKVGVAVELLSKEVKVAGEVYNNANQGQGKFTLTYAEPEVVKPTELTGCKAKIGTNNVVKIYGRQDWKWNGTLTQLLASPQKAEQTREWAFTGAPVTPTKAEEESNEVKLGEAEFTTIHFGKVGCKLLENTSAVVKGSVGALPTPNTQEEFSQTEKVLSPGTQLKQHDWNWPTRRYQGLETHLKFGTEPAEYVGEFEVNDPKQELAYFEE
jgi:hypothetical protein